MQKIKTLVINPLVAGLFGLFLSNVYCTFFVSGSRYSPIIILFFFIFPFFLFSLIAYKGIFEWAMPQLSNHKFSSKFRAVWFIGMMLVGNLLVWVIPIDTPDFLQLGLQIIATGDMNPQAKGAEVWLKSVKGDQKSYDLRDFTQKGPWSFKENIFGVTSNFPASLRIKTFDKSFHLNFVSGSQSGKVTILWDGRSIFLDLFEAKEGGTRELYLERGRYYILKVLRYFFYQLSWGMLLGFLIFIISTWLLIMEYKPERASKSREDSVPPRWISFLYSLPATLSSILFLLVFWPGVMTTDSLNQWSQMNSGHFTDWHPVFHTLTNWLITRIWQSPAGIALVQIATLCALIYWSINIQRKLGISKTGLLITSILFAIPSVSVMTITLWKDIFYGFAVLALSLAILEIVDSQGKWIEKRRNVVLMSWILVSISLYRHNGLPVAILAIAILLLVYKNVRKKLALCLLITMGIFIFVKFPLYQQLKVSTDDVNGQKDAILIHHIGAHLRAGTLLTSDEKRVLSEIRPLDDDWGYWCYSVNTIIFEPEFNWDKRKQYSAQLGRIALSLFFRDPLVDIKHTFCASSLVWRIRLPEDGYQYNHGIFPVGKENAGSIAKNTQNLTMKSFEPSLEFKLRMLLNSGYLSFMWRAAIYLYVAILAIAIFCIKKRATKYALFLLPGITQSGILFLVGSAQDFRYQFSICLIGIFSVGLILIDRKEKKETENYL